MLCIVHNVIIVIYCYDSVIQYQKSSHKSCFIDFLNSIGLQNNEGQLSFDYLLPIPYMYMYMMKTEN